MGENGSFDFAALYELRYACPRQAYSFEIRCAAHHAQDDRGNLRAFPVLHVILSERSESKNLRTEFVRRSFGAPAACSG